MIVTAILLGHQLLSSTQELMLLRTHLQNGATILAERVSDARRLEVQLWCSSSGSIDTVKSFGQRHMLEHLIARRDRLIDTELEKVGGYLSAATFRTGMQFSISVPAGKADLALETLRKLVQFPTFSPEMIKAESLTLNQEAALKPRSIKEAAQHWLTLGGLEAVEPAGPDEWQELPLPGTLTSALKAQSSANRLTLVVVGDERVDQLTERFKSWLTSMPIYGTQAPSVLSPEMNYTSASSGSESIGIGVPSFPDSKALARLAAALALIADAKESYLIYTPSGVPGVVTVGSRRGKREIRQSLRGTEITQQFALGRSLLLRWIAAHRSNPAKWAEVRGLLSSSAADPLLRDLDERIRHVRWSDFEEGYRLLEAAL